MNSKKILILAISTFIAMTAGWAQTKDVAKYVDPYIGTGDHGHVFLGANVPFGAVQVGPTNYVKGWDWCSGYHYSDSILTGFSQLHLSGTGIGDLGDILVMPYVGKISFTPGTEKTPLSGWATKYTHQDETVKPGYYAINLRDYGIKAELTASERVAFHKYTFPKSSQARIGINLAMGIGWDTPVKTYFRQVNPTTYVGYRYSKGWAKDQRLFFAIKLSKAPKAISLFDGSKATSRISTESDSAVAVLSFNTIAKEVVLMKIGVSPVSEENALANIQAEIPKWNFAEIAQQAYTKWNNELDHVEVESSDWHNCELSIRLCITCICRQYCSMITTRITEEQTKKYIEMPISTIIPYFPFGTHTVRPCRCSH